MVEDDSELSVRDLLVYSSQDVQDDIVCQLWVHVS